MQLQPYPTPPEPPEPQSTTNSLILPRIEKSNTNDNANPKVSLLCPAQRIDKDIDQRNENFRSNQYNHYRYHCPIDIMKCEATTGRSGVVPIHSKYSE